MKLRLVNAEAEIQLETIMTVDKAIVKMKNGKMAEVIEENPSILNCFYKAKTVCIGEKRPLLNQEKKI